MFEDLSIYKRLSSLCFSLLISASFLLSASVVFAKTPPEIRNQDELQISQNMHGMDLNGYEFVKEDLRGIDFGEADLRGAIFNNSQLQNSDLRGADLGDAVAFASDFQGADLRNANLTEALLMESKFENTLIEGADFTNAVVSRIQQKQLCSIASGTNPETGVTTSYSLGC